MSVEQPRPESGPPLAVVGGGIAGACVALAAAREGLAVELYEAGALTGSATWASGGMLAPRAEGLTGGFLELGRAALASYPAFLDRLEAGPESIIHRGRGFILPVFEDDSTRDWLSTYAERRAAEGQAVDLLEPGEVRTRLGETLPEDLSGGIAYPEEGWVDPRALLLLIHRRLREAGARIHRRTVVTGIDTKGAYVGVELASGPPREAAAVVLCAGHRVANIGGLRWSAFGPQFSDRGLMVRVHGAPAPPVVLYHHGAAGTTYVVPDPHGVRFGSTSDPHDHRTEAAPGEVAHLLERARRIWPPVDEGTVAEVRVGFRPGGPGEGPEPFTGMLDNTGRVWGMLGLHRNGILLAPHLADRLLSQMLEAGELLHGY